ncbi:hypothetical protein ACVINI_006500 [Rhizobium beringeri]
MAPYSNPCGGRKSCFTDESCICSRKHILDRPVLSAPLSDHCGLAIRQCSAPRYPGSAVPNAITIDKIGERPADLTRLSSPGHMLEFASLVKSGWFTLAAHRRSCCHNRRAAPTDGLRRDKRSGPIPMVPTTAPLHDCLDCGRRARAIPSYSRHQRAAAALDEETLSTARQSATSDLNQLHKDFTCHASSD